VILRVPLSYLHPDRQSIAVTKARTAAPGRRWPKPEGAFEV